MLAIPFICEHLEDGRVGIVVDSQVLPAQNPDGTSVAIVCYGVLFTDVETGLAAGSPEFVQPSQIRWLSVPGLTDDDGMIMSEDEDDAVEEDAKEPQAFGGEA